ncbi:MAG: Nif11-like leader peptide family natural product precursor [Atopobiaceae bacterium]|nr:Nif11-like leader peptide family natural product precursor [Atopobiaceae bacterium]MBR1829409.1 Nif11-like leader peptide family natural product precursor [Atopobiaceae bacterium]
MNLDNINPELLEKAKACKSADELLELAKAEGVELSEEQLDAINGGNMWNWDCPIDRVFCPLDH